MTELRDLPVFICGHPKSGTSLLRAIFDSHPQLVVYPEETVFFRRFLPRLVGLDLQAQLDLADETLIHIFRWNSANPVPDQEDFPGRDYSAIPYETVRQVMRQKVAETYRHPGDILSAAILAYGEVSEPTPDVPARNEPDKHRWVEKSPYNEYYADQIFAWWPEARCIHIVRDPRDNFVSYRRKHPSWSAEFFASNWKRSTQAGVANRDRYGADCYLILRYEDLTQAPEASLRRLVDFLQIDWNPSLAAPTRAGEGWQGNSMFADQFQGISAAPVRRWKESLSPQDAAVIELLAKSPMQAFAYPLSEDKGKLELALGARWRLFTWPIRRRFTRRSRSSPAVDV
jgi:protein-tyrosine sulfotransferase